MRTHVHDYNLIAFVYLRNTSGRWGRHWFIIQHGAARVTSLYLSSLCVRNDRICETSNRRLIKATNIMFRPTIEKEAARINKGMAIYL